MSTATLVGLRDYLFSTLNIGSMYWLANELNEYAQKKEAQHLKPYTMEEINAMIDQSERDSAAGLGQDSEEMFRYLLGYSPLHNLRPGTSYPATLVTTADHDDRVVPAHSFKFAATLQACNAGAAPALIRIDTKAGHGGGKPLAKVLEEQADIYSFILYNLGEKY